MESPTKLKAGIYLRVSSKEQTEKYGMALQRTKCEAVATVKDWEIIQVYEDAGISGVLDETRRKGMCRLLEDAEKKKIEAVIFYSLDRVGRTTQIVLRIVEKLTSQNIQVVSCRENIDTSSSTGRFTLTVFAALAQLDRETMLERLKAGREERIKADGDPGGRLPMGYMRTEKGLTVDSQAARIVRYIFYARSKKFTMQQICDDLNVHHFLTPRGHPWHPSSVRQILLQESKYRGGPQSEHSPRCWPAIFGPDEFSVLPRTRASKSEYETFEKMETDINKNFEISPLEEKKEPEEKEHPLESKEVLSGTYDRISKGKMEEVPNGTAEKFADPLEQLFSEWKEEESGGKGLPILRKKKRRKPYPPPYQATFPPLPESLPPPPLAATLCSGGPSRPEKEPKIRHGIYHGMPGPKICPELNPS